jgi:hypothetical protein
LQRCSVAFCQRFCNVDRSLSKRGGSLSLWHRDNLMVSHH